MHVGSPGHAVETGATEAGQNHLQQHRRPAEAPPHPRPVETLRIAQELAQRPVVGADVGEQLAGGEPAVAVRVVGREQAVDADQIHRPQEPVGEVAFEWRQPVAVAGQPGAGLRPRPAELSGAQAPVAIGVEIGEETRQATGGRLAGAERAAPLQEPFEPRRLAVAGRGRRARDRRRQEQEDREPASHGSSPAASRRRSS